MSDFHTRAALAAHQEWLGFVQPVGLVVAPPVLVERSVFVDRNVRPTQERFLALLTEGERPILREPLALLTDVLRWQPDDLTSPPDELRVRLPELGVTLEPSYAVADPDGAWQLLVRLEPDAAALDRQTPEGVDGWTASPQARFERLLRETAVPTGVILTPSAIRLVYAPKGETSGHITFAAADMASVMGRPILAALDMLLGERRLFGDANQRLSRLLEASREAQNTVSTRLARQVLGALHELLRGFVAADAEVKSGGRLAERVRREPEQVYGGLVTALMRLVFVLYAEDRDLMPKDAVYETSYSLRGLFQKLEADHARYGDLMDRRYGAWARLLALFRLIHAGGGREGCRLTARKGRLFDPDVYPFLEGRASADDEPAELPRVPDGAVWRILRRLLVLEGERLSYRTLDVEQIGSVYEVVMGFRAELTTGASLALKAQKSTGASIVVDLDQLLGLAGDKREKHLTDLGVRKPTDKEKKALKAARGVTALADALGSKVDRAATPDLVPAGTPVLQPTDERRRSGSHYTPRSLTEPIVRETLRPILERLGPKAAPEQILDLKVLDPAMGSAAFLVEACRQLAERLVQAWETHGATPALPADEDALLHARRLIAQRCLYGVDRNPMAAELGKLSLWLATLARDHEFTFLDHCIRAGDSLVGLERGQVETLSWESRRSGTLFAESVRLQLEKAEAERARIRMADYDAGESELREHLERAVDHLRPVRLVADAIVAAFFAGDRPAAREQARAEVEEVIQRGGIGWERGLKPMVDALRSDAKPVTPFHWWLEFPEAFDRENPGFDAIVGNPPFAGKNNVIADNREFYLGWLQTLHEGAHGNADLVAHFYRRAFGLLRQGGCFGLTATNTIRQGDTRGSGLRLIREAGGTIYRAVRRLKWPGEAAVVVCVVHVHKGPLPGPYRLDGREVAIITAFLFHAGGDADPAALRADEGKSFQGSIVLGMGFTFDDTHTKGVANPIALMHELIAKDARNAERIFPFVGGEEVNDSPTHAHHRFVINFEDFPLRRKPLRPPWAEADAERRRTYLRSGEVPEDYPEPVAADWPDLLRIVEERVRPERAQNNREIYRRYWWQYGERRPGLYDAIRGLPRVLAISRVGERAGFAFLPSGMVYSEQVVVFALPTHAAFCALQSRVHEVWARFFASSLEDRLRYTPSDCFETFPFPEGFATDPKLEAAGEAYYRFRADLMVQNDEGLTKTYNRFHDPDERSNAIGELRRLHEAMDRAVLDAYGWTDISTACDFELEWEDEDDGADTNRRRKKPWRCRWPEEVRDEVLARPTRLPRPPARSGAGATLYPIRRAGIGRTRRARRTAITGKGTRQWPTRWTSSAASVGSSARRFLTSPPTFSAGRWARGEPESRRRRKSGSSVSRAKEVRAMSASSSSKGPPATTSAARTSSS